VDRKVKEERGKRKEEIGGPETIPIAIGTGGRKEEKENRSVILSR